MDISNFGTEIETETGFLNIIIFSKKQIYNDIRHL